MVPDRAGADTRVDVIIPLRDLLGMDGASVIEDTWLRARAGQHGYLAGRDAEAVACDALIVPVVTGSPELGAHQRDDHPGHRRLRPRQRAKPGTPLAPEAWEALQYALARRAIQFVSGPGALASALRRSLLGAPLNSKSVILDVGYSDTIPEPIRRAVIARDKALRLARRLQPPPRRLRRPPHHAQESTAGRPASRTASCSV